MRVLLVAAFLLAACDDDSTDLKIDMTAGGGDDLSSTVGADFASGDLPCTYRLFNGFIGAQTSLSYFACPCGCLIDSFESASVSPLWGASHSTNASFAPMAGVGLGVMLTSTSNM